MHHILPGFLGVCTKRGKGLITTNKNKTQSVHYILELLSIESNMVIATNKHVDNEKIKLRTAELEFLPLQL